MRHTGVLHSEQRSICEKYRAPFAPVDLELKVGIARNVLNGVFPINGLRHNQEGDTTGWYIWAGEELPSDPNFFVPLHVKHLAEWNPNILKYLGLAPGWRFLIGEEGYEDVWLDPNLLYSENHISILGFNI